MLKSTLSRLNELGDIPYNVIFKQNAGDPTYHARIEILPRLAVWAGFEYESGTIINVMPPEEAAKFYRGDN